MQVEGRVIYRYSLAFKRKVVGEIERGDLNIGEARRLYDITGGATIQCWIRKLGENHLLNKVVRIEMKDEKDRVKQLEKEKTELEKALAQTQLKVIALESLLECAEEEYGIDVKKNSGTVVSLKSDKKLENKD